MSPPRRFAGATSSARPARRGSNKAAVARMERKRNPGPPLPHSAVAPCGLRLGSLSSQRKLAEQRWKALRLIERPQRLQDVIRLLFRPALSDIASEFPFHLGSGHRPFGE